MTPLYSRIQEHKPNIVFAVPKINMQEENEIKTVKAEKEINGHDHSLGLKPNACDSYVINGEKSAPEVAEKESWTSDCFYEKLNKFYESSGLSLVFNFRETKVDLYQFYKDVTERGGFHQVTNDGKWDEVALGLSSRDRISMSTTQIQKLYAYLLYQFEQTYNYSCSSNPNQAPPGQLSSVGKRKHCDSYSGLTTPLQKASKDRDAPVGSRSAYQMYLKMECDRMKKIHGDSSGSLIRDMAIKAWGNLSDTQRKPFYEASKKDRERYNKEMAEYKERKSMEMSRIHNLSTDTMPTMINFAMPMEGDGAYHVTLPPDTECVPLLNQSTADLEPNDPIFQMNWDEYYANLDIHS